MSNVGASKIFLVRHASVQYLGKKSDLHVHLTTEGQSEAVKLSRNWIGKIDRIYSSPLERAVETVTPLALDRGIHIEIDADLAELNYNGDAPAFHKIIDDNPEFHYPGGETLSQAKLRFINAIEQIAKHNIGKTIVISTHGTVLSQYLIEQFGASLDQFNKLTFPDIYSIDYYDNKFYNMVRVIQDNHDD